MSHSSSLLLLIVLLTAATCFVVAEQPLPETLFIVTACREGKSDTTFKARIAAFFNMDSTNVEIYRRIAPTTTTNTTSCYIEFGFTGDDADTHSEMFKSVSDHVLLTTLGISELNWRNNAVPSHTSTPQPTASPVPAVENPPLQLHVEFGSENDCSQFSVLFLRYMQVRASRVLLSTNCEKKESTPREQHVPFVKVSFTDGINPEAYGLPTRNNLETAVKSISPWVIQRIFKATDWIDGTNTTKDTKNSGKEASSNDGDNSNSTATSAAVLGNDTSVVLNVATAESWTTTEKAFREGIRVVNGGGAFAGPESQGDSNGGDLMPLWGSLEGIAFEVLGDNHTLLNCLAPKPSSAPHAAAAKGDDDPSEFNLAWICVPLTFVVILFLCVVVKRRPKGKLDHHMIRTMKGEDGYDDEVILDEMESAATCGKSSAQHKTFQPQNQMGSEDVFVSDNDFSKKKPQGQHTSGGGGSNNNSKNRMYQEPELERALVREEEENYFDMK